MKLRPVTFQSGEFKIYIYIFIKLSPPPATAEPPRIMAYYSKREAKLKKEKKNRKIPLYAIKLLARPQTEFQPSKASYNCSISLKSGVHPPGCTPSIPPYKPPQHYYPGPFSLLARHTNLFSLNTPSRYQSFFSGLATE